MIDLFIGIARVCAWWHAPVRRSKVRRRVFKTDADAIEHDAAMVRRDWYNIRKEPRQ